MSTEKSGNHIPKDLLSTLSPLGNKTLKEIWPELNDAERNFLLNGRESKYGRSFEEPAQRVEELFYRHEDHERRFENSRRQMKDVGVPPLLLDASKNSISPDLWAAAWDSFQRGRGLYIHGPVGVGKSYLAAALIREHFESWDYRAPNYAPPDVQMISVPTFLAKLNAAIGKPNLLFERTFSRYTGDIFNLSQSYPDATFRFGYRTICFFDDIGSERPTDWAVDRVSLLVNSRYECNLQTVFTTNLSLEKLGVDLGDRVSSRIAEMCTVVKIEGPDRRITPEVIW